MRISLAGSASIDEVILIDREVDTVTPLCTQLTYEGLLDEILGIRNGSVSIEKEGEDGPITGFVRIRSRSQGLALSLGSLKGLNKIGTSA